MNNCCVVSPINVSTQTVENLFDFKMSSCILQKNSYQSACQQPTSHYIIKTLFDLLLKCIYQGRAGPYHFHEGLSRTHHDPSHQERLLRNRKKKEPSSNRKVPCVRTSYSNARACQPSSVMIKVLYYYWWPEYSRPLHARSGRSIHCPAPGREPIAACTQNKKGHWGRVYSILGSLSRTLAGCRIQWHNRPLQA